MPKRRLESSKEESKKRRKYRRKLEKYQKKLMVDHCHADSLESDIEPEVLLIPEEDTCGVQEIEPGIEPILEEEKENEPGENDILPDDVLEALGSLSDDKGYGEPLDSNILKCFEKILYEGIGKEEKENLLRSIMIPENAKMLEAPKLNLEVSGLMNNGNRLRDSLMEQRQAEMGVAIANICQTIDSLSKKDYDKIQIIKKLSESVKLLSNLHYTYKVIRKKLISPLLDKNLDLNLKDNKRSEWLYTRLDETVKSLTVIKKASSALAPKKGKNWQPPRPQMQAHRGRGPVRGGYYPRRTQVRQPLRHPQPQQQPRRSSMAPPFAARGRARYP